MKNRFFSAAALAFVLIATPLAAQIMTEKDVSTFTFVYDGADLVGMNLGGSVDWTPTELPAGSFPAGVVEGTNLRFPVAGGGYYKWNQVLSDDPGWTFEATYQITQAETSLCGPFGVNIGDGVYGDLHAFYGGAGGVKGGTSLQNFAASVDFTDGMHTLRYAEETGGEASLWIDKVLISDSVGGLNYAIPELLIGYLTGNQADGEVLISQVAVDTSGAFAPVDQIIPEPPSGNDLDPLSCESFGYQYRMDKDPSNVADYDLDANGAPDFAVGQGGNGSYSLTGTAMEIASPDAGDSLYLDGSGTGVWATEGFESASGITIETKLQIVSQTAEDPPFQVAVFPSDSSEFALFDVYSDTAVLCGVSIPTGDNTDGSHVFRVVRDTNARGGLYWLWRDGMLMNEEGIAVDRTYAADNMYFGDGSGSAGGTTLIEYLCFENAAYKPEASAGLEGDLNGDGMVGSADLDIVRGNWGATVEAGCLDCGDPSGDGVVGSADLDIVRANWGATAAAAVPEPSVILLALAGLMAMLVRRR